MGTVVHSEAQEGNKYILTHIMKAIVTYALAAFAAIAATPNPIEAWHPPTPALAYRYDPYDAYPAYPYDQAAVVPRTKREYDAFGHYPYAYAAVVPRAKRQAGGEYDPFGPYEYDYDYGVAPAKHDTSDHLLHDERLTKREEFAPCSLQFAPQDLIYDDPYLPGCWTLFD